MTDLSSAALILPMTQLLCCAQVTKQKCRKSSDRVN